MLLLCKEAQIADQSSQLPASSIHQTVSGAFLDHSPGDLPPNCSSKTDSRWDQQNCPEEPSLDFQPTKSELSGVFLSH